MSDRERIYVFIWLAICAFLVFCMVLLGGAVRLTGSGLSMVDWKPVMGVLPPLDEEQWTEAFRLYQNFPEYRLVNKDMELTGFKFIFLMEYAHRILGRVIGLVFFIPFIVFLFWGNIYSALKIRLWVLFSLGGLQGIMGWYMVKSGLVDVPNVSQYRLVAHLMMAVIIYGFMVRILVGLYSNQLESSKSNKIIGAGLILVILLMIASGGFVAGTKAGFIFNTFPLMGETWIPDQIFALNPVWKNLFENPILVQFVHRCLAVGVAVVAFLYAISNFRQESYQLKRFSIVILLALFVQLSLGISALIYEIPVILGVAHQAGALILLTVVLIPVFATLQRYC